MNCCSSRIICLDVDDESDDTLIIRSRKKDMIMVDVESSHLAKAGHDGTDLLIEFKKGNTYRYYDVPVDVFEDLISAPSIGRFFNVEIRKGGYKYEKED